jgi:copper homeostasis protein CutC
MDRFSKKCTCTKFREYPSSGSRVFTRGETGRQRDRHDEGNNHVSQFLKLAKKNMDILDGAGVWSMYMGVRVQMF